MLKDLQGKNGYIRTVEKEEYDFYQKLVERDLAEEPSPEELEKKTKVKINRANADREVIDGAKNILKKTGKIIGQSKKLFIRKIPEE